MLFSGGGTKSFPSCHNCICPSLPLEKWCPWLAIVPITEKTNKIKSLILKSLHFFFSGKWKPHCTPSFLDQNIILRAVVLNSFQSCMRDIIRQDLRAFSVCRLVVYQILQCLPFLWEQARTKNVSVLEIYCIWQLQNNDSQPMCLWKKEKKKLPSV